MTYQVIAKLEHKNHLKHLIKISPLIVLIYGAQCLFLFSKTNEGGLNDLLLLSGLFLASFIGFLSYYDNNQVTLLFEKHLYIRLFPFKNAKVIYYKDIDEIITTDKHEKFSSILIRLNSGEKVILHLIDYPLMAKHLIEELKKKAIKPSQDEEEDIYQEAA